MLVDLVVAALMSLMLGTGFLELYARVPYPDVVAAILVCLSIAAGPYYLWRRGRQPLIPITAIFCVLMFFAILVAAFLVSAAAGRVDL